MCVCVYTHKHPPTHTDYDTAAVLTQFDEGEWERVTYNDYWNAKHKLPLTLLEHASARGNDQRALHHAAAMFASLVATHPEPPDYFWRNAGIAFGRLRAKGRAHACRMVGYFGGFLERTDESPHDPAVADIARLVRNFLAHVQVVAARAAAAAAPPPPPPPAADARERGGGPDALECEPSEVARAKAGYLRHHARLRSEPPPPAPPPAPPPPAATAAASAEADAGA